MKKDLQNVIITFGIITIVFTQGSIVYLMKAKSEYAEYVMSASQESFDSLRNQRLVREAEARRLQVIAREEILRQQQLATQNAVKQVAVSKSTTVYNPPVVAVPPVSVSQSVVTKKTTKPSRQSKAS